MKRSPFKFLDAYAKEDASVFFGRDFERQELYNRIVEDKLLLVYGASGTGKTSLVQCGLASKFDDDNWLPLFIRRGKNINQSLINKIQTMAKTNVEDFLSSGEAATLELRIESLYLDFFRPIYLIFDQFEELFILGTQEERDAFFQNLRNILNADIRCHIILIIREEYLAHLSSVEAYVPTLFENRMRIEAMHNKRVKEVVLKSCTSAEDIHVADKAVFLDQFIRNLSEDQLTVELTYLQVYLDKLYRNAIIENGVHVFDPALLESTGKVEDVLGQFLDEQVQEMPSSALAWKILKAFVTLDGTKQSNDLQGVHASLSLDAKASLKEVETYLAQFVELKVLKKLKEQPGYLELAHDSLALETFERLTARERNLLEVKHFIEHQHRSYASHKALLSQQNIDYVSPYLSELELTSEQAHLIKRSREKLSRRRRIFRASVLSAIVALSILSVSLYHQNQTTSALKDKAVEMAELEKTSAKALQEQNEQIQELLVKYQEAEAQKILSQVADLEDRHAELVSEYPNHAAEKIKSIIELLSSHPNNPILMKKLDAIKHKYEQ